MIKKLNIKEEYDTPESIARNEVINTINEFYGLLNNIKLDVSALEREYKPISIKSDKLISNDLGVVQVDKATYLISCMKSINSQLEEVEYYLTKIASHSDPRFKEAKFIISQLQD